MSSFLRLIRGGRWLKFPDVDWLQDGELQGDAFSDLQTSGGKLSIFKVDDETDKQRVVIALAANRDDVDVLDYAVFEDSNLASQGIVPDIQEGETPDKEANQLHYELRNMTVTRLAQLAEVVAAGEHKRILKKQIKSWLQKAVTTGDLNKTKMKRGLLQSL